MHAQVNYYITGTIDRKGVDKVYLLIIGKGDIDSAMAAWQKTMQEDKTSQFIHTNIADFGKAEAFKFYQVNAIPSNFLINPEGRIVAMNLRGDELVKALTRVIK